MATTKLLLEYPLDRISEPVFTRLVTEFDVQPNVLSGNIDASRGGWLMIRLEGPVETLAQATDWIRSTGIHVIEEQTA